jgi:hypothetical protein
MGMYAAAITLDQLDFDLLQLLSMSGFDEGGPNVHSLSPITWLTALVIRAASDTSMTLPVLHVLHWLMGAVALAGVYELARHKLPPMPSVVVVSLLAIHPLVLVQLGDIYLEVPLFAVTAWSMVMLLRDRLSIATALAMVAAAIKPTGLIVAGAIAIYLIDQRRLTWRSPRYWPVVAGPLVVALTHRALLPVSSLFRRSWIETLSTSISYALHVGDVALIVLGALGAGYFGLRRSVTLPASGENAIRLLLNYLVVFHLFFLVVPVTGVGVFFLPRYYVIALPFALVVLVGVAWSTNRFAGLALVFVLGAGFAINSSGSLYNLTDRQLCNRNFAVAERSGEYLELLALHIAEARAIEQLETSVYVTQPLGSILKYPEMGYISRSEDRVDLVMPSQGWETISVEDLQLPAHLVVDSPLFGGTTLLKWWDAALSDPSLKVTTTVIEADRFAAALVRIDRSRDGPTGESNDSVALRNTIMSQRCLDARRPSAFQSTGSRHGLMHLV